MQKAPQAAEASPQRTPEYEKLTTLRSPFVMMSTTPVAARQKAASSRIETGLRIRLGDPADHEERTRDDHDGRRGGARITDRKEERELRRQHAEAVDHDVTQQNHVGEELRDPAPFGEERHEREEHARAEDAKRHEVLGGEAAVRHHDLSSHPHGAPAEACGDGKKKAREHAAY